MGIGQGTVIATPLQVARWTSGIATGAMVTPQLAAASMRPTTGTDSDGAPHGCPSRTSSDQSERGCGHPPPQARPDSSPPAGDGRRQDRHGGGSVGARRGLNAWFSAVVPFESPEIVVTALVRGGGFGSATSGPVVKALLERYLAGRPAPAPGR